jgi:hypothetical protein
VDHLAVSVKRDLHVVRPGSVFPVPLSTDVILRVLIEVTEDESVLRIETKCLCRLRRATVPARFLMTSAIFQMSAAATRMYQHTRQDRLAAAVLQVGDAIYGR